MNETLPFLSYICFHNNKNFFEIWLWSLKEVGQLGWLKVLTFQEGNGKESTVNRALGGSTYPG